MSEDEFLKKLGSSTEVIEFATTPARAFVMCAQLQLAVRHPGNDGASAASAREIVDNLAKAIDAKIPGAAAIIETGWNPAFDMTREYYESEFSGEGPSLPFWMDTDEEGF